MNIFMAILILFIIGVVVHALNMTMMSALMQTVLNMGVIALIIIFQPEIRSFLIRIGSNYGLTENGRNIINKLLGVKDTKIDNRSVNEITEACRTMSAQKTGALIVIPQRTSMSNIVETGDKINAIISRRLIMNLFFKNSPLHDGAVIIKGDKIVAARCTLPITDKTDIPANYGMRHKAALGVSEQSDADIIVVSEETGQISYVNEGKIMPIENINELKLLLNTAFHDEKNDDEQESSQSMKSKFINELLEKAESKKEEVQEKIHERRQNKIRKKK